MINTKHKALHNSGGGVKSNPYNIKPDVEKVEETVDLKADKAPFVHSNKTVLAVTAAGTYNIDLSKYLPQNDPNAIYEVWFNYAQTTRGTATQGTLTTDVVTSGFDLAVTGSNGIYHRSIFSAPVKSKVTLGISTNVDICRLGVNGYRKVN